MRRASTVEDAAATLYGAHPSMAAANTLALITEISARFDAGSVRRFASHPFGVEDAVRFDLTGPDLRLPPQVVVALRLGLARTGHQREQVRGVVQRHRVVRRHPVEHQGRGRASASVCGLAGSALPPPRSSTRQTSFGTQLSQAGPGHGNRRGGRCRFRPEGLVFTAMAPVASLDPEGRSPNRVTAPLLSSLSTKLPLNCRGRGENTSEREISEEL